MPATQFFCLESAKDNDVDLGKEANWVTKIKGDLAASLGNFSKGSVLRNKRLLNYLTNVQEHEIKLQ